MALSIREWFPEQTVSVFNGTGYFTTVDLIRNLERAECLISAGHHDIHVLKLWILYKCYLEIVWGIIWDKQDKKSLFENFTLYSSYAAFGDTYDIGDAEVEYAKRYTLLLEESPSCAEIVARLMYDGLRTRQSYAVKDGQLVSMVSVFDQWDAACYILTQYIAFPDIQRQGGRSVAYCEHCGSVFLREHGSRKLCPVCRTNAERQRAYRERKNRRESHAPQE